MEWSKKHLERFSVCFSSSVSRQHSPVPREADKSVSSFSVNSHLPQKTLSRSDKKHKPKITVLDYTEMINQITKSHVMRGQKHTQEKNILGILGKELNNFLSSAQAKNLSWLVKRRRTKREVWAEWGVIWILSVVLKFCPSCPVRGKAECESEQDEPWPVMTWYSFSLKNSHSCLANTHCCY